MLRKHSNALLGVVRAANVDPGVFTVIHEESDGYQALRIQVGQTPLYFAVRGSIVREKRQFDYHSSTCTIAHPQPIFSGNTPWGGWFDFEHIETKFKAWLEGPVTKYLAYQAEEAEGLVIPDLWAEFELSSGSPSEDQALQNTLFSSEEQNRVKETLSEFEEQIKTRKVLSDEQANLLHERIEYLVESSKRLGRKDWLAVAVGALVGFTVQAGLTSETAMQILQLAGEALRWIAHSPLLLPR